MAGIVDLSFLPDWSYWRTGAPDLIADKKGLSMQQMMRLIGKRSLKIELRVEGVQIDPMGFAEHLDEWSAAYTVIRLRRLLEPIMDDLDGDDPARGEQELADLARWLRSAVP